MSFREFFYYSPMHDSEVSRVSMFDGHGREYHAVVMADRIGRSYREARERALAMIERAIELGLKPGEVRVR